MKLTVFAAGSRGDIQPCVALGKGLQQAGYRVALAAPEDFAGNVERVTIAEIKDAFARRVNPERMVTVVVGPDAGQPAAAGP